METFLEFLSAKVWPNGTGIRSDSLRKKGSHVTISERIKISRLLCIPKKNPSLAATVTVRLLGNYYNKHPNIFIRLVGKA